MRHQSLGGKACHLSKRCVTLEDKIEKKLSKSNHNSISKSFNMVIESLIHTGPVTALYHGGGFILAGIGSCLHVCVKDQTKWLKVSVPEVLPGRNVHGIKEDPSTPSRFITYGQKCMQLIEIDLPSYRIKLLHDLIEFPDWIWDITWLKDKTDLVCLALGHNVVMTFDLASRSQIQSVNCTEKCILYCAKFIYTTSDTLILAAGTVFNEVVLWSPLHSRDNGGYSEPFHRLTGHQGVIFSIDYNLELRYLCSASDDRSIRLYKIEFPNSETPPTLSDWMEMRSTLLYVLYGHQARVWSVRLLTYQFISVGEDSTCCVWSYEGRVLQKFKGHKGKSIWSVAVSCREDEVITGGGDHSVRLWKLHGESGQTACKYNTVDLKLQLEDFPRNTMFLDIKRALVITNEGNLLMYNCESREITCLMSDPEFSSYTVMAVSKSKQLVVMGNIKGTVKAQLIGERTIDLKTVDMKVYDGKVHSVVFVSEDVFVTTGPDGKINVWRVIVGDQMKLNLTLLHVMELPHSKHRWVTTACFTNDGNCLVCGDRTGSVFLYRLQGHDLVSELIQKFPKLHGKSGVTEFCFHGNKLYSVGRDGLYRLYTWDEETINLKLQNSNRVFKGFDWLERIVFTEEGDTMIYGFHTNMFVVWNINQNQKVLEIDCGGGHRTWDFVTMETNSRFVYIKARKVKVVDIELRSNQTVVKQSMHGREICDVKHLYSYQDGEGHPVDIVLTCSEDTTINIVLVKYDDGIPQFSVVHTLTGHISSVRCLAVCPSCQTGPNPEGGLSVLVFSGGGRAQIRFWRVHLTGCDYKTVITKHICDKSSVIQTSVPSDKVLNCDSERDNSNSSNINEHDDSIVHKIKDQVTLQSVRLDGLSLDSDNRIRKTEQMASNDCNSISSKIPGKYRTSDNNISSVRTSYETLGELKLGKAGRHTKKPWKYPVDNSDPETRILDLCLFHGKEISPIFMKSLYFFAAACSDGLVRLFSFEESSRETNLISSSKYHNHCVLKTTYLTLKSNYSDCEYADQNESDTKCEQDHPPEQYHNYQLNRLILLSAATDGVVAFYDISDLCYNYALTYGFLLNECIKGRTDSNFDYQTSAGAELVPIFHLQLHQSGVNSVHINHLNGSHFVLLTGGDDNALTVSYLNIEHRFKTHISLEKSGINDKAHAAQVTGVWWLGSENVLSVSIDQRLCLWRVEVADKTTKLSMSDCKFISVSDVSNIDVFSNGTEECVIISGEGLQLFKLNCQEPASKLEDIITKHTQFI